MRMLNLLWIIAVAVMLVTPPSVSAKSGDVAAKISIETGGVGPDSILWGLDVALDQLSLLLTFNNTEKAQKGLNIARERLLEIKDMILKQNIDAAQKAQEQHVKILVKVKSGIGNIQDVEQVIDIESKLEEHEEEIVAVEKEVELKINIKGTFDVNTKELIDSILNKLGNNTGELKIDIKEKKDNIKIKIKQETGKSEVEIEKEFKEIEEQAGINIVKREKALERIEDAKELIGALKSKIAQLGNATIPQSVITLLNNSEEKLANAEAAFAEEDFGEAFGQANAARNLAKNALRILERQVRVEEEIEIKAKLVGNTTSQIEVEIKFAPKNVNKDAIIDEILNKTRLTKERIGELLKIEIEEEEKQLKEELEVEVRIKEGLPRTEFEWKFPLNTTDRENIIDEIAEKLASLTIEQIENALEFELKEKAKVKVEVEVENNVTEVEVKANGAKFKFTLEETDRENIIDEIAKRTGLTIEQIEANIKFEVKDVKLRLK